MSSQLLVPSALVQPKGVQIPSGALDPWKTAKASAAAGSAQVNIVFIGDSFMSGYTSTNWRQQSWYWLLMQSLTRTIPLAGEFIPQADSAAMSTSMPADAQYWTLTTAGTLAPRGNQYLPFGMSTSGATANTDNMVFDTGKNVNTVAPIRFVDCDLLYSQAAGSGSAFTVTIDGVSQTGDTYNAGAALRRKALQYTGLANTPHALVVTHTTANQGALGGGVVYYPTGRNATGLVFCRHCLQGNGSQHINNQYQNGTLALDGYAAAIADWPNTKLVIYDMMGNDCQGGIALDTTMLNLSVCMDWTKAAGASFVLIIPYPTSGLTNYQKFMEYAERSAALVLAAGGVVVSLYHTFLAGGAASWLTGIHPNDTGNAQIANTLISFL